MSGHKYPRGLRRCYWKQLPGACLAAEEGREPWPRAGERQWGLRVTSCRQKWRGRCVLWRHLCWRKLTGEQQVPLWGAGAHQGQYRGAELGEARVWVLVVRPRTGGSVGGREGCPRAGPTEVAASVEVRWVQVRAAWLGECLRELFRQALSQYLTTNLKPEL